jgi:putative transposase
MHTKTHTIRLFPSVAQEQQLRNLMRIRNIIWNKLVYIRDKTFQETKKGMSDFDLMNLLPTLKQEQPELSAYNSKAAQVIAKQIGAAYRSFFRHLKNGNTKARSPGIVDENKIVSLTFNQSGWSFKNGKITLSKLDDPIAFKSKEDIGNLTIKEIRIKLRNGKWLCDLIAEYNDDYQLNNSNNVLALDLGLTKLATGIDNTGKVIVLPNRAKKISQHFGKQISKVDQKISSKKEGSRRHKKFRQVRKDLFKRKNAQVKQALHIQSKQVANMNYHTIVLGDLSVKELMSKENNKKKGVRKSFAQSAIDTFRQFLTYKCQGKTNVVEIDERHTTQTNCLTGKKFKQKVELKDRTVQLAPDIIINRDLNSAINILKRWESFHLAALIPPLDLSIVFEERNLFERTTDALVR